MRYGRAALSAVAAAAVMAPVPVHGDPGPAVAGQPLPALTRASLAQRYAAARQTLIAAARAEGNDAKARRLAALAAPGRQFLAFGRNRAVEVIGDLATARRVAILVPGSDTTPATFDSRGPASPGGGARALYAEARRIAPQTKLAVIAWLGYDAPHLMSLDVATTGRASAGARALVPLTTWLASRTQVGLLCHSYGSVVCARAAKRADVTDIAVFGSPGLGVSSARGLHTTARLWAGRGGADWMAYVPKVRWLGLGFGADPTGRSFGAHRFATGHGGHSDYLKPGTVSLHNLTLIALGRDTEVTAP